MSGRPPRPRPDLPRVDLASDGTLSPGHRPPAHALEINVSSKTDGRSREFRITRSPRNGTLLWEGEAVSLLPSAPNLCYHRRLGDMERRRFKSGDPTPGRGCLHRTERRMALATAVLLMLWSLCSLGTGRSEVITSFLIQPRRLTNGGATAMSRDPNL